MSDEYEPRHWHVIRYSDHGAATLMYPWTKDEAIAKAASMVEEFRAQGVEVEQEGSAFWRIVRRGSLGIQPCWRTECEQRALLAPAVGAAEQGGRG